MADPYDVMIKMFNALDLEKQRELSHEVGKAMESMGGWAGECLSPEAFSAEDRKVWFADLEDEQ